MSFGRRLRLFLVAIVAIPMVVLAVLVVAISRDSRDGKADARLASGLDTAQVLYDEALAAAPDEALRGAVRQFLAAESPMPVSRTSTCRARPCARAIRRSDRRGRARPCRDRRGVGR